MAPSPTPKSARAQQPSAKPSTPGWSPRPDSGRPRSEAPAPDRFSGRPQPGALFIDGRVPAQVLNALNGAPGAQGLSEAESAQLKRLITSSADDYARSARVELAVLLSSDAFLGSSPEQQTGLLKAFVKEEVGVPDVVSVSDETRISRKEYSVASPVAEPGFAFGKHPADGKRYDVTIGARKVPVHVANGTDEGWQQHPVDQVAKALAALPDSSLALVKEVRVEPAPSPMDEYFARVYNRPDFHAYMTAGGDGVISIFPTRDAPTQRAIDGTIIHETGHILSHQLLGEQPDGPKWAAWRDAEAKDGLHPSQYARINPDEDLAEALELYTLTRGGPSEAQTRALFPARFEQLDTLLTQKVTP